jgi:hypothetical protein
VPEAILKFDAYGNLIAAQIDPEINLVPEAILNFNARGHS